MNKPFKGVISKWSMFEGRIHGNCVFHTTYENGIAKGFPITTSPVVAIIDGKGGKHLETKNSWYLLV